MSRASALWVVPQCCLLICCLHAVKLFGYTLTILAGSWLGPELDCYNRVTGNMDERGAERPETSLSRVNHQEPSQDGQGITKEFHSVKAADK